PEYLFYYTKSYPFKKWIESNQRISGQPNINGQEFLQSPLILPPLDVQKEISSLIQKKKAEIVELKNKAIENKELAIIELENEIFES
ncbi:restriction endonuclease subunit S, partial [Lutibacter sp.]|uniref:restriction endonuclease subunit S n=1 Tax=Lutibacter sp. TaxID=1925666 RepID=UPI0034A0784F